MVSGFVTIEKFRDDKEDLVQILSHGPFSKNQKLDWLVHIKNPGRLPSNRNPDCTDLRCPSYMLVDILPQHRWVLDSIPAVGFFSKVLAGKELHILGEQCKGIGFVVDGYSWNYIYECLIVKRPKIMDEAQYGLQIRVSRLSNKNVHPQSKQPRRFEVVGKADSSKGLRYDKNRSHILKSGVYRNQTAITWSKSELKLAFRSLLDCYTVRGDIAISGEKTARIFYPTLGDVLDLFDRLVDKLED